MIDALLSLAVSMHARRGAYAVLLGSGVSRSAEIPTGWDVTLDLIRKVAKLQGEDPGQDPEAWWADKYGVAPSYSKLLDKLAKTQTERSQILQRYFEPSEDDPAEGSKVPTPAHKALARLVKAGYVRVLLTTNFDRLMEQALEAEGVHPTVIHSPDAAEGAVPLAHADCTLVKLHGDYRDTRIKNTPGELAEYDPRMNELVDRILDEYGLVLCGWSAEWDTALARAFERCKGHRFTTYWTRVEPLSSTAEALVRHRQAEVLTIEGADSFFPELAEKVEALERIDRPHPLSARVAVAQAKKHLTQENHIALNDLLMQEVERIAGEAWSDERYPVESRGAATADVPTRIESFEALSESAVGIMATGCYWGGEAHADLWVRALCRLANPAQPQAWNHTLQGLRSYPAVLLLYAGGIATVAAERYDTLYTMLSKPKVRGSRVEDDLAMGLAHAFHPGTFNALPGLEKRKLAGSERLYQVLREPLREFLPDDAAYRRTFDRFEALLSLWTADTAGSAMPGAFMYREFHQESVTLEDLVKEQKVAGEEWPLFKLGFFLGNPARWCRAMAVVKEMRQRVLWS